MQESIFTNYDQLPLFLNANTVAQVLNLGGKVDRTVKYVVDDDEDDEYDEYEQYHGFNMRM